MMHLLLFYNKNSKLQLFFCKSLVVEESERIKKLNRSIRVYLLR